MSLRRWQGWLASLMLLASSRWAVADAIRLDVLPESQLDVALTLSGTFNGTDSDSSDVTGFFDTEIDFDSLGRPTGVRIVGADLSATDVSLSILLGPVLGSLYVDTQDLHLTAYTPDAPPNPPVNPETGLFDLDLHRFVLDGGTATADSSLYSGSFDFAVEPEEFTPLDGMTGTLTQAGGIVRMVAPVELSELVTTIDLGLLGTVDVLIELEGTLVAEGIYDLPNTPGDTNGDGLVDLQDLNNVRNNFGGSGLGDTNEDGIVDLEDLNAVRNNFGAGGSAVPEPATGLLLIITLSLANCRNLRKRGEKRQEISEKD